MSFEHQAIYIDRVIDRVDEKLIEKLAKMDILYTFPNLMMGTRTVIVLKQPKTEGSIRTAYLPETVVHKLETLKQLQTQLKNDFGEDGYMDYGLVISAVEDSAGNCLSERGAVGKRVATNIRISSFPSEYG